MRLSTALAVLQAIVGMVLIVSGVAKVVATYSDRMVHTIVFDMLGGSSVLIYLLSAMEIVLGMSLVAGVFASLSSMVAIGLVMASAVIVLIDKLGGGTKACGCFGDSQEVWGKIAGPVSRSLILLAGLVAVLVGSRSSANRSRPPLSDGASKDDRQLPST